VPKSRGGRATAAVHPVCHRSLPALFSNAELARATGGNLEMHNLTACVVALKEK